MKQVMLYWVIALAGAAQSIAAPVRQAITRTDIAVAVSQSGIGITPDQVVLLSDGFAAIEHPQLRVESIQRWDNARLMVRLACVHSKQCLPFFVAIRVSKDTPTKMTSVRPSGAVQDFSVRSGSPATLLLERDHVHIRLVVTCLENGRIGQTIRATDKDHRTVYTAEVIDRGILRGRL